MNDLSDTDLAFQIQSSHDSGALVELISRHSGIYVDMIKRFGGKSLTDMQQMDLMGEKDYNIYKAALEYDPEKSKFSTYLANRTRYLCLADKTTNKKSPHLVDFDSVVPFIEDDYQSPDEQSEIRELMMKLSKALDSLSDQTAKSIFYERYFSTSNHKLKPWKEIGKSLGLSGEWCSQVHDKTLPKLRKQLNNAETTF
jgi:RNA polymerase sigma factor (sigma-70 family)